MIYAAATIVLIASLVGVGMTLLTFPGIWTMVVVALLCQWWQPELFHWGTLVAAIVLAVIAEIVEAFASAAGAAKAKGSKTAMLASLVGAIVGALFGTFIIPIPILGTVIGGVAGAGLGAGGAEWAIKKKGWSESLHVAKGAATGRALSLVAKTAIAVVVALVLSVAAFVP
ncbi:MAG TPA: DUF456 family protein [Phycisphaerales bacterium]|nr:DUF456 family protein [Phycisphaerales bacterium]